MLTRLALSISRVLVTLSRNPDVFTLSVARQMGTPSVPSAPPLSLLLAWPGQRAYCRTERLASPIVCHSWKPLEFMQTSAWQTLPPFFYSPFGLLLPPPASFICWLDLYLSHTHAHTHWHSWISTNRMASIALFTHMQYIFPISQPAQLALMDEQI